MIRVCVDGTVFRQSPRGGIARYWSDLFKEFENSDSGLRFDVVLPPGAIKPSHARSYRAGSLTAYRAARQSDIFHSTYYTRWPRMRCPQVVTVYDFIDAMFPMLRPHNAEFVDKQRELIQNADAVVVISETTRQLTVEHTGVDPSKIFLAYPCVPLIFAAPVPSAEEGISFRNKHTGGAPYLLHVGYRQNYKNFRKILRAYCNIAAKTDRHLLVVGACHPPSDEEIDCMVSSHALHKIHFLPNVDDEVLRLAYAGADAMVHATLMEGFGIPLIEALASGTGLIISDIPVYREIAGSMATFVDPSDTEAWEEALLQPVSVQTEWRDAVLKRFTPQACASAHLNAYKYALQARGM